MAIIGGNSSSGAIITAANTLIVRTYNTSTAPAVDSVPGLFAITGGTVSGNQFNTPPLANISCDVTEKTIFDFTGSLSFPEQVGFTMSSVTANTTFKVYVENVLKTTVIVNNSSAAQYIRMFFPSVGIKDLKVTAQLSANTSTLTPVFNGARI